jgi:hypothetical protein
VQTVRRPHTSSACDGRGLFTSFSWSGERILSGFIVDPSDPTCKFVVELLIDGLPVKAVRADEYVHELARQGVGDSCYGFSFPLRDELVNGGLVAEARIANLGTIMSAPAITAFRHHLIERWLRTVRRRGQKHRLPWGRMKLIANRYLPYPRILHPWPEQRFLVTYPR